MDKSNCFKLTAIATSILLVVGCNSSDGSSNDNTAPKVTPSTPLVDVTSLVAGDAQCANGGVKVNAGLDVNNNQILDAEEILTTEVVCNGLDGTDGQDGQNGNDGQNGTDGQDGTDGQNGTDGQGGTDGKDGYNALVAIVSVAQNDNTCQNGGQKILVGLDTNRNNILDKSEVSKTSYMCSNGSLVTDAPIVNAITISNSIVAPGSTVEIEATLTNVTAQDTVVWTDVNGNVIAPMDAANPNKISVTVGQATGQETYTISVERTNADGSVVIQSQNAVVTVGQQASQTQAVILDTQQVFLPEGYTTTPVTGDIKGTIIYADPIATASSLTRNITTPENVEMVGFVAERPSLSHGSTAESILNTTMSNVSNTLTNGTVSQFSQTVLANGDVSASYNIQLVSGAEKTATEVLNEILTQMAANKASGTADALIPAATETAVNEFQLDIALSYDSTTDTVVMTSTLVAKGKYALYSDLITATTSENVKSSVSATLETQNDSFTALNQQASKADFLFVIDNSGSMSDEQDEISQLTASFENRIANAGIDFQVGTITTDSTTLRGNGFTNDPTQIALDFKPGINGNTWERGIQMSESALRSATLGDSADGSVTAAGYPRAGASLSVVIMSDERSQYAGNSFDVNNNLFVERGYRVYAIVDPDDADRSQYDDLAVSTFGQTLNITAMTEYDTFMDTIANNAGATSAGYKLTLAESHKVLASSISVNVEGNPVTRNTSDGWQYYPLSGSIVFTGSAIPAEGETITVAYQYVEENTTQPVAN
ncbi:DUF7151 family protein [Thaumasiovibrio subtropicus]|uniref:DUF7151 family protein n=1 Tax=Thaumasiovibrio subtropicus TaxID=1891207 RepID=UPI000B3609DC|nr:VWA domain-containing protein [Thaumasiovibrio subtropicus]